ncbi:hypothetical protein Q3G72_034251 [Acer saccharum]|nr:hypothetical protein Q3G72_034251 [Acer saccharum]
MLSQRRLEDICVGLTQVEEPTQRTSTDQRQPRERVAMEADLKDILHPLFSKIFSALYYKQGGDGHTIANHEAVDGGNDKDEQQEEEMDADRLE